MLIFFGIEESPYFLYSKGRIIEMQESLNAIAAWNKPDEKLQIEKKLKSLFSNARNRQAEKKDNMIMYTSEQKWEINYKVALICVLFINICTGYYLAGLVIQRIGNNSIYINGLFLELSELLAYSTVIYVGNRLKRKMLNFYVPLGILILAGFLLLIEFMPFLKNSSFVNLMQTTSSLMIRYIIGINFGILYNYASELMPTQSRGYCLGVAAIFNKAGGIAASIFEDWSKQMDIHPMIFSGTFSFFALFAAGILPETLNKTLEQ